MKRLACVAFVLLAVYFGALFASRLAESLGAAA